MVATAFFRPSVVVAQAGDVAKEAESPGLSASVAALGPSFQAQGPVVGSTGSTTTKPFAGSLTLRDAIQRGLEYNLATVGLTNAVGQARGRQTMARSVLLPNITGDVSAVEQRLNLSAMGVRIDVPGFSLSETVGPFNVVDLRARLSQTVLNLTARNNYRAATETLRASELSVEDSRDLIVLAVGGAYLETLAARERLQATRAQVETANTIHQRALQQRGAGLATPIDVNRAQVQTLTAQQRLVALQSDFAKRKINLARMIGLPPTDRYELAQEVPFAAAPARTIEEALKQAAERRSDLKAAEAQVRAAEHAVAAARAERLPSVLVSADVGTNRASSSSAHGTFSVAGVVRVPIWEGGRTTGAIEQASSALSQRRAELEDLRSQIEGDLRKAFVDLEAAASQVDVAQANLRVTRETLGLTRQRFDAGVSDNVSVVQSQESLAAAELDYINSVFAHNIAKLGLARTIGRASEDLGQYLQLP